MLRQQRDENVRTRRVAVGIEKDGMQMWGREARLVARMRLCLKLRQGASPLRPRPLSLEMNRTEGRKFFKGSLRRAKREPALDKFPAFRETHLMLRERGLRKLRALADTGVGSKNSIARSVLDRYRPSHGRRGDAEIGAERRREIES
jgi:hypothetical protein